MILTPLQQKDQIDTLKRAIQILEGIPTSTPCGVCVEFSGGYCNRHQAHVPDDFQAKGCADFCEVPF